MWNKLHPCAKPYLNWGTPNPWRPSQLHDVWHGNNQDHPKSCKSNGHWVSLAPWSWTTATISILLATRKNITHQLFDQVSLSSQSQTYATNFSHQTKNTSHSQTACGDNGNGNQNRTQMMMQMQHNTSWPTEQKMTSATVACLSSCKLCWNPITPLPE